MEEADRRRMLDRVYTALVERGYRPVDQIMGYILTGDPAYITNYNGARTLAAAIDRHELLHDVVADYFSGGAPGGA